MAPRQTGKTTFLAELHRLIKNSVYVDFNSHGYDDLHQIAVALARAVGVGIAKRPVSVGELLIGLQRVGKLVFLVDEVCTLKRVAVDFLRSVRGYHGECAVNRLVPHTFVFAGSSDLVDVTLRDDPSVSPFNVAHPVYLEDFTLKEVQEFITKRAGRVFTTRQATRVFDYTRGHPYLLQFLCSHLYSLPTRKLEQQITDLKSVVDASGIEESVNVQSMLRHLADGSATFRAEIELLRGILSGLKVRFTLIDPVVKRLYLEHGCIRREKGACAVRNPIYRLALERNPGILPLSISSSRRVSYKRAHLKEVFVSYAWGGESETIVDEIQRALSERGIEVIRDKAAVGYRDSIRSFMKRMGRGSCVIVVLSKRYLKSKNCMFELTEIAERGAILKRVFPLVLPDTRLYDTKARLDYIRYWEREKRRLDAEFRTVGGENLDGMREDLDLCSKIRARFAGTAQILADMNTLRLEDHRKSGFQDLARALEARLSQ